MDALSVRESVEYAEKVESTVVVNPHSQIRKG